MAYVIVVNRMSRTKNAIHEARVQKPLRSEMEMCWDRPWLMDEKTRMRITPRTMTAVPLMSLAVTAGVSYGLEGYLRVPTSQRAKRKLKMSDEEPSGATQSGRRYLSARGDPTEVSEECLNHLQTCEALTVSNGLWPTLTCTLSLIHI